MATECRPQVLVRLPVHRVEFPGVAASPQVEFPGVAASPQVEFPGVAVMW
jgi:hypothetical protein